MNKPKPILFIENMQEDTLEFVKSLNETQLQTNEMPFLYWYSGYHLIGFLSQFKERRKDFCFICSLSPDLAYIDYVSKLLGISKQKIHILPIKEIQGLQQYLGNHCEVIRRDEQLMSKLKGLDVVSFCCSDQLMTLMSAVEGKGRFLESSTEQSWAKIKRIGTKSGIRELIQKMNNQRVEMPKGKIFYQSANSFNQAIEEAANKLKKGGVIIKTDKGKAGHGVEIVKKSEVQNLGENETKVYLEQKLKDPYWKMFSIVVEDFINVNYQDQNGGAASCFFTISQQGKVQPQCFFRMIITGQKEYHGTELGKGVYNQQISQRFKQIGRTIGKQLAEVGYQGQFGIDYILDDQGKIYVVQANLRRTGSAPAYYIAKYLLGPDFFKQHYVMFCVAELENLNKISFSTLIEKATEKGLAYTKKKGGIIFAGCLSMRDNQAVCVVIASSRQEAQKMLTDLKNLALI